MSESLKQRINEMKQLAKELSNNPTQTWQDHSGYSLEGELSAFVNLTTASEFYM